MIKRRVQDSILCSVDTLTEASFACRGIPIKLEAVLPRSMGAGAWRHRNLIGYTSVGAGTSLLPVRLNCPPEITLHTLRLLNSCRGTPCARAREWRPLCLSAARVGAGTRIDCVVVCYFTVPRSLNGGVSGYELTALMIWGGTSLFSED